MEDEREAHIRRILETPYEDLSELAELVEDESVDLDLGLDD